MSDYFEARPSARAVVAATLATLLLGGCAAPMAKLQAAGQWLQASAAPTLPTAAPAVPAAPARVTPAIVKFQQSATQRDLVGGGPVFALCDGRGCWELNEKRSASVRAEQRPAQVARDTQAPRAAQQPQSSAQTERGTQGAAITGSPLARIAFAYNDARLSEQARQTLDGLAPRLARADAVRVVGLADTQRNDAANQALAQRRANAVAEYLRMKWPAAQRTPAVEVHTRLVRVANDGSYPPDEPHKGRRADVIELEVD
jgi:outer membrane protein OmpA-like peptidoglycan-associated protein